MKGGGSQKGGSPNLPGPKRGGWQSEGVQTYPALGLPGPGLTPPQKGGVREGGVLNLPCPGLTLPVVQQAAHIGRTLAKSIPPPELPGLDFSGAHQPTQPPTCPASGPATSLHWDLVKPQIHTRAFPGALPGPLEPQKWIYPPCGPHDALPGAHMYWAASGEMGVLR